MSNEKNAGNTEDCASIIPHRTIHSETHSHEFVYATNEIAECVNSSAATIERRLGGLFQEALSASRSEFEVAIVEHTDRCSSEIEGRLQEKLPAAHAKLEATTSFMLDQHIFSIGEEISACVARTETSIPDHLFQLSGENERRLQSMVGHIENGAVSLARANVEQLTASIEQRLRASLDGAVKEHSISLDLKFQESIREIHTEAESRASVWADLQGDIIEEKLQQKLNAAMNASRLECHNLVDISSKEVVTSLKEELEVVRQDVEFKQEAQQNWVETRMQQMLRETQVASQTAVSAMEERVRDVDILAQMRHREIEDRVNNMKQDLERKDAVDGDISEQQWQKIRTLIDDKFTSISQDCGCLSSNQLPPTREIDMNCTLATSASSVYIQTSPCNKRELASGPLDNNPGDKQEIGGEFISAIRQCINKLQLNQEVLRSRSKT